MQSCTLMRSQRFTVSRQQVYTSPCCRDRGVTMLVRVDISAGTNGVLSVALSHQAAGFAPYRIDNCTAAMLHLRQVMARAHLEQSHSCALGKLVDDFLACQRY